MSGQIATKSKAGLKAKPVSRIVCNAGQRKTARSIETRFAARFEPGEPIRSIALIKNDGMYPHKDVGEALVHPGDTGTVRESWRFLGEIYYTVEFIAHSVFVIMRGDEMARMGTAFGSGA